MSGAILVGVATASSGLSGVRTNDLPADALLDGIRAAFLVAGLASSLAIIASTFRGKRRPVSAVPAVPVAALAEGSPADFPGGS
jgi:hypothetical protein